MAHIKAETTGDFFDETVSADVSLEGTGVELLALLATICQDLKESGTPPQLIRASVLNGLKGIATEREEV